MSSSISTIIRIFNDHFNEFLESISKTFPGDLEVATAKNTLHAMRKVNPKMIIRIWRTYIADRYQDSITNGDINFFIEKDYEKDLVYIYNADRVMTSVNRLRDPIRRMNEDKRKETMKYIQNLSKLSQSVVIS